MSNDSWPSPDASPDTSSISFTALYTGHVWAANGLSAPAFRTRMGSFYYHALAPFEYIGGKIAGGNIRTFLLQRHYLIDHLVTRAIEEEGVTQVLEIACGLSPRGCRFTAKYPQLKYIEADLPEMADRKQKLLAQADALNPLHQAVALNALATEGPESVESVIRESFDADKPLLVITEGLVNYFDLESINHFWVRLRAALAANGGGMYLTDNYPLLHDHPFYRTMKVLRGMLGTVSRSRVSFHFGSDAEAQAHFEAQGFAPVTVHNPKDYYDLLPMPRSRGNPFVRVIEGRV